MVLVSFAMQFGLMVMNLLITLLCIRVLVVMVHFFTDASKELLVEVVEDASEDTTEGRADDILPHVVCEDALWVVWIPGHLHHELSDSQGWVETCTSEGVDVAESPEDQTDGWHTPDTEIGAHGALACHMKDEKNEDESADDFHVCGRPVLTIVNCALALRGILNHFTGDCRWHHEWDLRRLDCPVTILLNSQHDI